MVEPKVKTPTHTKQVIIKKTIIEQLFLCPTSSFINYVLGWIIILHLCPFTKISNTKYFKIRQPQKLVPQNIFKYWLLFSNISATIIAASKVNAFRLIPLLEYIPCMVWYWCRYDIAEYLNCDQLYCFQLMRTTVAWQT